MVKMNRSKNSALAMGAIFTSASPITTPTSSVAATVPSENEPILSCPAKNPSVSVRKTASSGFLRRSSTIESSTLVVSGPFQLRTRARDNALELVLGRELHAERFAVVAVLVLANAIQQLPAEHDALGRVPAEVHDRVLPGVVDLAGQV